MLEAVLGFLRRHTTITNKAILAVYGCSLFYRTAYTLFLFSIIRFLREGLSDNFLLIGILWATGNVLMILIDLPLGALQRYFKPRYFLLVASLSLFGSALVFILATELTLYLAVVALLLFQFSIEIYWVVIATSILRLSDDNTYAQNISQQSLFDNTGKIIGLAMGGVLFFVDRAVGANHMLVAFSIAFLAIAATAYIYFVIDAEHYNSIERAILERTPLKMVKQALSNVSDRVLLSDPSRPTVVARSLPPFVFGTFVSDVRQSVVKLVSVARNLRLAPVLTWGMVMLVMGNWWFNSISTFEPVFIKEIYRKDTGWIAENVPRYFFESVMLILAIVIPTIFAVSLGKLADWWGKWKMVVVATIVSGIAISSLIFTHSAASVFVLYLVMEFSFITISPALTGLLGQEFKALNARLRGQASAEPQTSPYTPEPSQVASAPSTTATDHDRLSSAPRTATEGMEHEAPEQNREKDDNSEGESAGVISIGINIGEIGGGLFGGFMLQHFGFTGTFIFFGPLLLLAGFGSILLFTTVFPRMRTATSPGGSSQDSLA